ncbi:hypothetical protein J7T55_003032 [Diaporthe amygdali]|uniref:uncharacterized protein n=1 Tax=Phomopsis amygdali TaxID=1214568 RepID=UPI0022FE4457|nr:uncharacterized protein J7T55_003032 [Diaporthe amygdali]KAJ0122519.1 hypothetical protein J7T55_003032 [Diaporthe amygdali]
MSVRNLRAMFENKTQESPPERGRSPAGTESPRPLSKVRTSFVAIEKDGRIGLQQRNPSEASSISGRKLSGDTEATSSVQLENTSTDVSSATSRPELNRGPPRASFHTSPPPPDPASKSGDRPSPPAEPPTSGTLISGAHREVASLAGSSAPKGLAESPQIKENQTPGGRKSDQGSQARKAGQSQASGDKGQGQAAAPESVHKNSNGISAGGSTGGSAVGIAVGRTVAATTVNGADKTKGAKPAAAAAPAPAAPAPAPISKITNTNAVKSPDPAPQPKAASKPTNATSHPPTTPKAGKPAAEKKAAPASVSPGGFVKPRPKSPTRPVKLPASLTTHTAASGSRTRTSGSAPPSSHENLARSTSRSKASAKALQRSSSAASRQRPSIGPPPKQPAKDHPVVKKDARVDEGFLARMMRPTQSSASKVNEKVPVTPPRRPAAAPKKSASAKSVTTRRPVSKTTSATTSAAPSPERTKKESSADRDIATVIEKMSIAENVQETPKTPEREATIMEEMEEEKSGVIPMASAAPEASNEPEVEEAEAPLVNGTHKEDTTAQPEQEEW